MHFYAPVDDKPKIKLQTRISSSGQQYVECGVMSGTCDQCLKHSLTCMLWEGKGKRIALSCSFCASSKKKCTFDGTASSDFNKNVLKPVKDMFPKAKSVAALKIVVSHTKSSGKFQFLSDICFKVVIVAFQHP
ncbi:hypothetical protein AZE42_13284 [Rhizopogon vesiculosus]|uniref:Uncharacterized protein n=1 Tax=Rhizopogon vesiculosus TaxID=180088 RepID=A0A1J8QQS0_9AGAM|nr:hypothetical protein AZE42_13284 [Rhizopogon vesiculosus]